MIQAAENGEVDVILSYSNSRLTRRPLELEHLINLHNTTGVLLRTLASGAADPAPPGAWSTGSPGTPPQGSCSARSPPARPTWPPPMAGQWPAPSPPGM